MTFSDPATQEFLARNFVCAKVNLVPGLLLGGASHHSDELLAQFPEGGGGGNVRSIFCTSDGQIVSEVKGFWRPDRYREEATLALRMNDAVSQVLQEVPGAFTGPSPGLLLGSLWRECVNDLHTVRARELEQERADIEAERAKLTEPEPKPSPWARKIAALNRMARSHRESIELIHVPVEEYLDRIADEVWTKGNVG